MRCFLVLVFALFVPFMIAWAAERSSPLQLEVDLTDSPRKIFHSKLTIPATPGAFTLVYPKWVPGNHRPAGPIANLTGIRFAANGQVIPWQRDPLDMYAFHLEVPPGVKEITSWLDVLSYEGSAGGAGSAASTEVLDLNWNQVLLYPQATNADDIEVQASVRLPSGWQIGTALPGGVRESGAAAVFGFNPVSLTTLVDSPLIAGRHYRHIQLSGDPQTPPHVMDIVAEGEGDLEISAKDLEAYHKLVAEAGALFGAWHYRQYHFLLTLSDQVGHHGLEHHESSDNGTGERMLLDLDGPWHLLSAGLLPHEFTHSWNGKYRRPAGLATRNYQEPMVGDLLWVYEGLTEYLGNVLTARSGLWSLEQYREALAETAANMDHTVGRSWRPLRDTAVSVQLLRLMGPEWQSWRRGLDYYPEGELVWLEVDTRIRQLTAGKRSLDAFCRRFFGGQSGPPMVVPYTLDDIVNGLNEVAAYDWAGLLKARVDSTASHAPLAGIESGGWRLVYNDTPNGFIKADEKLNDSVNIMYSLGLRIGKEGEIRDVVPGSPAYQAGIGPGMKLMGVNGRKWSPEILHSAIHGAGRSHQPIELLLLNSEVFETHRVPYYEGEKNPHLERVSERPDLLGEILGPRTGRPAPSPAN